MRITEIVPGGPDRPCRVTVGPPDGTERTMVREWLVTLIARPPALPEGVLFAGTVGEFLDETGA